MEKNNGSKKWIIILSATCLALLSGVIVLLHILLYSPYSLVDKDDFFDEVGENLSIPVVEINTSSTISSSSEYISCSFEISNTPVENESFSVDMKDSPYSQGGVGIRLRGNYTQKSDKKAYRVRFNEKTSLLGLTANKSWVLLADYYDQSSIRNYTALSLASYFDNMDFSPTPNHVALIMDGEFKGLYLLCEQVNEKNGRCDIEVDDLTLYENNYPFLVCVDSTSKDSSEKEGRDYFNIEGWYPAEIKYPSYDERPQENDPVFSYIQEYMRAVFTALKTGKPVTVSFSNTPMALEDLVDIDSLIDYYLIYEIMCSCDVVSKSIYAYKEAGGKLKFGPVWDFDWSMSCEFEIPYAQSHIETANDIHIKKRSALFYFFFENYDYETATALRFQQKKHAILAVCEHLKSYKAKIDSVATIDAYMYYGESGLFQYDMQYDYVRLYLLDRYSFLEKYFSTD